MKSPIACGVSSGSAAALRRFFAALLVVPAARPPSFSRPSRSALKVASSASLGSPRRFLSTSLRPARTTSSAASASAGASGGCAAS
ncbi:MAG: hypothetical protein U0271_42950 [Polyangiaceae bacterium]